MEPFYEMLDSLWPHDCERCGERMWVNYGDGHVWETCLVCPPEPMGSQLDIAGYVLRQPEPVGPLPPQFESIDRTDVPYPHELPHERKLYRRRVVPLEGTTQ